MNTRKLLVSVLMLVSVLFSACAPAATLPVSTVAPPIEAPIVFASTPVPGQKQPKTFSSGDFEIPLTLTYTGWTILEQFPNVVTFVRSRIGMDLAFINVKDVKIVAPDASAASEFSNRVPFPDDFVTWIQAHNVFQVEKTQPVLVGGFQGTEINANATAACGGNAKGGKSWIFLEDTHWICGPGGYFRFIYLDNVYGERILIMNTGGYNFSAEDFQAGVEASQKILDTVVFSKP